MFDPWTMISIIKYINILDFFEDRERVKREMMNEYKLCFDRIGDNTEAFCQGAKIIWRIQR